MKSVLAVAVLGMAVMAGCAGPGPGTRPGPDHDLQLSPLPALDGAAVVADLRAWSGAFSQRMDNHEEHEGARQSIAQAFADAGLEVHRQDFTDGIDQANIIGIKWGTVRDQWVVVGAHYDMVTLDCVGMPVPSDSPDVCATRSLSDGTYDDGSGTMLVMHLAKAFANASTHYTIAFVAFDGEERGLQGSGAFVEAQREDALPYRGVTFRAMLDLDMFGLNCPGVDTPIFFDSNSPELQAFVRAYAANHTACADTILYQGIQAGRSDYAHFFDAGVPTGFFISDFERYQLPADVPAGYPQQAPVIAYGTAYPFWHLADTYDTMLLMAGSQEDLDAGFQTAADLSAAVVHHMASSPDTLLTAKEA